MKRLVIILISVLLSCILFVSCSDIMGGLISLDKLRSDDLQAMTTLGDINCVYGSGGRSRSINTTEGQSIDSYLWGNNPDYVLDTYVVVYDQIKPNYVTYIETVAPQLAWFQKGHYKDLKPIEGLTYVEYSSWRNRNTGEIFAIDIRVAQGDFYSSYESGQWYAKQILFDPSLQYDLTRRFDIISMRPIYSYDPSTGAVTYAEEVEEEVNYDDGPKLEIESYYGDSLFSLLYTITPNMTIYYEKTDEGFPALKSWSSRSSFVEGFGVCSKEDLSPTFMDNYINEATDEGGFLSSYLIVTDYNPATQYLFEVIVYLKDEKETYEVRLHVPDPIVMYYRTKINKYNSVEEFNEFFAQYSII